MCQMTRQNKDRSNVKESERGNPAEEAFDKR